MLGADQIVDKIARVCLTASTLFGYGLSEPCSVHSLSTCVAIVCWMECCRLSPEM